MVGNSQLKIQAKQQWERLNAEGHGILNELIMTETDKEASWLHAELLFLGMTNK